MGRALRSLTEKFDRAEVVRLSTSDMELIVALSAEVDVIELAATKKGRLDRSPKSNWVEDSGGLPAYIEDIAVSLHEKRGMTISRAIAVAVGRVKKWAAGGDNVKPDTRAKAAAALAQWEKLKARNKARQAKK